MQEIAFRGEQKFHGYKMEVSGFLDERAVEVSKHFRGSISDFVILCKMRTTHEKWPAEKKGSVLVLDVLPLSEKFPIL